jgi:peptidyl-prolyl cis-trans isomerase D
MLIQRMRDGSEGVMAKIIIGLIIIVFGLFGFGSITTFLAPVAKVATVNGEEIPQQDMEIAVERNRRMMLARDVPIESINEDELREDVLESLISREILTQAADSYDLYYGDSAVDAEIVAADVFKLDGVFNADQFQRVIGSAGYSPLTYREEMRKDKKFEQLLTGIVGSAFLMDSEASRYNELLSQKRDLAYLQIQVGDLVQEITISDEEIEDYYNDNNQDFVTSETVSLEYVELKRSDLADDLDIDEEQLRLYFETNRGSWSTDESRRIAHILVEISDEMTAEQAEQKAVDLHERIKNGEDFSALAMERASTDRGGISHYQGAGYRGRRYAGLGRGAWRSRASLPVVSH